MTTRETWPGGHVHVAADGRKTYVIRKRIGGKRHTVSTRCTTLRAAMVELERFEADPAGYEPGGVKKRETLPITDELAVQFLRWSEAEGNTAKYLAGQKRCLLWWRDVLKGADLRTCGGGPIRTALVGTRSKQLKIATIKRFCGWLVREVELLRRDEDPTETIMVPQSKPEQWKREKAIPREEYERVRGMLGQKWLDAIDLLAGTGWHLTELDRFAAGGEVLPAQREGEAAILVCPRAKSGAPLRTAVSAEVEAAARRLRELGSIRGDSLYHAIKKACARAGLPQVKPGSFRHSVATWAIEAGADPAAVAAFLGHASPATTKKFYATHAAPKKVPTMR